jgi:hypothetical protein
MKGMRPLKVVEFPIKKLQSTLSAISYSLIFTFCICCLLKQLKMYIAVSVIVSDRVTMQILLNKDRPTNL